MPAFNYFTFNSNKENHVVRQGRRLQLLTINYRDINNQNEHFSDIWIKLTVEIKLKLMLQG